MFDRQMDALADRYRCVAFDFQATAGARSRTAATRSTTSQRMRPPHPGARDRPGPLRRPFAWLVRGTAVGGARAGARPVARRPVLLGRPPARLDVVHYRMLQAMARRVGIAPLAGSLMNTLFGKSSGRSCAGGRPRGVARGHLDAQLRGALLAVDGVLGRDAVIDELPRITIPTLVVVGEHDPAAPIKLGERIRAGVRGSRLTCRPDRPHLTGRAAGPRNGGDRGAPRAR